MPTTFTVDRARRAASAWAGHRTRAKLRRIARYRYRDECGRFARAPGWWRPRDDRGRFLPLDHLKPGGTFSPRTWIDQDTRRHLDPDYTSGTIYTSSPHFVTGSAANVYANGEHIGTATVNYEVTVSPPYFDWPLPAPDPASSTGTTFTGTTTITTTPLNAVALGDMETRFSGYTDLGYTDYVTFTPPRFGATVRVTRMEMVELGDEEAIQMAVDRAKREMDMTFRREGLEVDFNQGVWRQWTSAESMGLDAAEVSIEWTPQPRTQEAWATWTSPAAQRLAGDTPMVEDDGARRARQRREARQRAEREERARQIQAREVEREAKASEARKRARELMEEVLAPEQVEQWDREKAFTVETADGRRRYKIRSGRAGNIYLMKDGERDAEAEGRSYLKRYCFHEYHPTERPPVEDNVIAQSLYIQAHEEEFLAAANEF